MWDIVEPVERNRVGYWRPMLHVALTFATVVGGGTATAYHALSLLLHLGATVAAFALAKRITKDALVAASAALLFALHPVQVESVAWVSSMNSMLFGLFALLSIERYLAWRERGSRGVPWASGLAFLLALLSKELAIAVVPTIFVLDWIGALRRPRTPPLPDNWGLSQRTPAPTATGSSSSAVSSAHGARESTNAWAPYSMHLVAFGLYYCARAAVFQSPFAGFDLVTTEYGFDAFRMALLRVELLGGALALLAWPHPLVLFRPVRPDSIALDAAMLPVWIAIAVVAALVVLAIVRRAWVPLMALALVLVAVAPSVIGVKSAGIFPLCERYLYFAVFGFALLAAWAAHRFLPRVVAIVLVLAAAQAYGWQDFARAKTWRDDSTVFLTAIERTTNSPYVWWLYGRTELELYRPKANDPKPSDVEHLNKARAAFEHALELGQRAQSGDRSIFAVRSDFVQANVGYAWTLLYEAEIDEFHDFDSAIKLLVMIVERYPNEETGHTTLGVALQHLGRFDEAEKAFQKAIAINPLFVETWHSLGIVRLKRGDVAGAAQAFDQALALRPEHLDTMVWLARAEAENGHAERALALLQHAVERYPKASSPLVWRATVFAQQGRFDEAIELVRRALELDPNDGEAHLLKGRLHARVNETTSAEHAFVRASELLPQSFEANYNAAAILLQRTDYGPARAIAYLVRAYQLRPPGAAGDALRTTLQGLDLGAPDILWELASADAAREANDEALDWIGRALAKKADHGPSHFLKAFLLRKRGDPNGAIENWTLACAELPKSVPARMSLANVLIEQERFAEALQRLEEAQSLAVKEQGQSAEAQAALAQLQARIDEVRARVGPR
ncbi:MAG: tetratricopeptide repeat protein [Planctomycetes bacterium]|nr:tetratricopeptide repeat protein [Planctomycetota bacterium]